MKYLVLIGRIFFSFMFVYSGIGHFSQQAVGYAESAGVPFPTIAVPLSGVLIILGGLSIAFGFQARLGAWFIIIFLVPVTLFMHNFWAITDPAAAQMQFVNFEKNLVMLGGALLIAYFGAGPLSFDSRTEVQFRKAQKPFERVKTIRTNRPEEKVTSRSKEKVR